MCFLLQFRVEIWNYALSVIEISIRVFHPPPQYLGKTALLREEATYLPLLRLSKQLTCMFTCVHPGNLYRRNIGAIVYRLPTQNEHRETALYKTCITGRWIQI